MTAEAQRIAIATATGWTDCNFYEDNAGPGFWNGYPPYRIGADARSDWEVVKAKHHQPLPDYLNSLDAMHEAEKVLTETQQADYVDWFFHNLPELESQGNDEDGVPIMSVGIWQILTASPAQRAEAFLRTLGLWKEDGKPITDGENAPIPGGQL